MPIEIIPLGGYSEIGRNCVAIKVDEEIVILDMGIHLEHYINYTESAEYENKPDMTEKKLVSVSAIPNANIINNLKKKVVGICISHAHLDHVGAVPYMAHNFKCPVFGTPFTIEVLQAIYKDQKIKLENKLEKKEENSRFRISKGIEIEFVHVTHSTPQTIIIVVHAKYGSIVYANDIKLDRHPSIGEETNIKRLKEIKAKALILNCLYATTPGRTDSEDVPIKMLKKVLFETEIKGKNIFVTTFSSQIARIRTVATIAKKMGRKVIFLGRSLAKYTLAAEVAGVTSFADVKILKYSSKVKKFLSRLKNTEKYLFIVTGNQGEPNATLSKIVYDNYFKFKQKDMVIFSCTVIPVQENIENRRFLEEQLKQKGVEVYKDIHASGHARHEDHRELLQSIKPEHLLPVHGDISKMKAMKKLGIEEGIKEKDIHILKNGDILKL